MRSVQKGGGYRCVTKHRSGRSGNDSTRLLLDPRVAGCFVLALCSLAAAPLTDYEVEYKRLAWRFGLLVVALAVARVIEREQATNQTVVHGGTGDDGHTAPFVSFGDVISKLRALAAVAVSTVACLAISAELGWLPATLVAGGIVGGFALGRSPGCFARMVLQAPLDLGMAGVSLCSALLSGMQTRDAVVAARPAIVPVGSEPPRRPVPLGGRAATGHVVSVAHESGWPGWLVPTACFVVGLGILLCLGMLVPDVEDKPRVTDLGDTPEDSLAPQYFLAPPPVLAPIEDQVAVRGQPFVLAPTLLESGSVTQAAQSEPLRRFSVAVDAPLGLRIDPTTGVMAWTPGDDVEPGQYPVMVRVEIGDDPTMSDEECFTVWLRDPDRPPVLAELSNQVLQAGEPLMMEIKLDDIGSPPAPLRFELTPTAPAGAHIHPEAGILTWVPDAGDSLGAYPITVCVFNTEQPELNDRQTLRVVLRDALVKSAPVLAEVLDQVVRVGEELVVPIEVADAGTTAGRLRFSLQLPAPRGARVDPATGVFTWTPGDADGGVNHPVIVRAQSTDNPALRAEISFAISVIRVLAPATTAAEKPDWTPAAPAKLDSALKPAAVVGEPQPLPEIETAAATEPDEAPMLKLSAAPDSDRSTGEPEPEPAFTNSVGMHLLLLPAGEFDMGSTDSAEQLAEAAGGPADRFRDELPRHHVHIARSFYMSMHEVTVGQFRAFVRATGYKTDAERNGQGAFGIDAAEHKTKQSTQFNWQNPGWRQTDDHPVVNVSWNDAVAYCRWLSSREGRRYRLPTEAEWEYACRADTETRYYTGDDDADLSVAAHFGSESFRRAVWPDGDKVLPAEHRATQPFTIPVGQLEANGFSLYDMHGNVFEWCGDHFARDYYGQSPLVDPTGPATGTTRVIRGGSFYNLPLYCRSSYRNGFAPETAVPYLGFRVTVEVDQPK
jgi:formylglycine-generating enzyme required for sulfatase activity